VLLVFTIVTGIKSVSINKEIEVKNALFSSVKSQVQDSLT
jgi:hypothetical protein